MPNSILSSRTNNPGELHNMTDASPGLRIRRAVGEEQNMFCVPTLPWTTLPELETDPHMPREEVQLLLVRFNVALGIYEIISEQKWRGIFTFELTPDTMLLEGEMLTPSEAAAQCLRLDMFLLKSSLMGMRALTKRAFACKLSYGHFGDTMPPFFCRSLTGAEELVH